MLPHPGMDYSCGGDGGRGGGASVASGGGFVSETAAAGTVEPTEAGEGDPSSSSASGMLGQHLRASTATESAFARSAYNCDKGTAHGLCGGFGGGGGGEESERRE